jgi:xanthine/uracil permease
MEIRYALEERPPFPHLLLFGLQWLAVALPGIVILGQIVGALHFDDPAAQLAYLQKLAFLSGATLGVQVLLGHRLPLVLGPAAVLLVGVVSSRGASLAQVYTAVFSGGLLLFAVAISGILPRLQRLFTPRVVAVVLLLIAFTLAPTLIRLVTSPPPGMSPFSSFLFSFVFVLLLFAGQSRSRGVWRSTVIVWGMAGGTAAWFLLFPASPQAASFSPPLFGLLPLNLPGFAFDPGVLTAFLFCALALAVNDLGSMQALDPLLHPEGMPRRVRRGMALTGAGNALSGLLGVVGPVNFSLSPGVIAATGCASRFALLPAAAGLLILSLFPAALAWVGAVPPPVTGAVLVYILSAQIAAGLQILAGKPLAFPQGVTVGLPLLLGTMVAFLPPEVIASFPPLLRPILGNGFVVGTAAVLLLEHVIFRE